MNDTNATALRNALAAAIKHHVSSSGMNARQAAAAYDLPYSRLAQIIRGDVAKISSDALVNVAGSMGYRVDSVIGSNDGHEFILRQSNEAASV